MQDRINVAWELGEFTYDNYPGGGPGPATDLIDYNFGIPIDHYVILDFADFIALVDEVGGVEIDVPEYVADSSYTDCEGCYGYAVEFAPGVQHMDGQTALAYARIRKGSNDFKRIERQQLVIQATAEKAFGLNLLTSPGKALDLYKKYRDAVETDMNDFLIPGLAKLAQQIGTDNIRMVSIASATYPCRECTASVLNADWDMVTELKAEEFASFLRKQGISDQDLLLGDAATVHQRTLIVDRSGKEYTAKKLAEWLNVPSDRVISGSAPASAEVAGATGDIVGGIGSRTPPGA